MMTKHIQTSVTINASKEKVWDIFMDFKKYPEWNSFMTSVSGEVKKGNRIKINIQDMTFKPVVLTLNTHSELKWLGHLWFKGLFDGEHQFKLIDNGDGTTTFEQNEVFNGVLVKLFSKKIDVDTRKGFEQMNRELKSRAENLTL